MRSVVVIGFALCGLVSVGALSEGDLGLFGEARAAVAGEGTSKAAQASRTPEPPKIDGRLDEAVWNVPVASGFTQAFPDDGKPATFATEFRVLYDDSAVYVAVRMHDPEPAKIVRRIGPRDREVEADAVSIFIDSEHGHNSGYQFRLTAGGQQTDALVFKDNEKIREWDAVWSGAVSIDASGWTAEFGIPLRVLRRIDEEKSSWGFQVEREVTRLPELTRWVHVPLNIEGLASRMGHLEGLAGITARREFEFRPYVLGGLRAQGRGGDVLGVGEGADVVGYADLGADLRLGVTSGLVLNTTINPDFGNVEVDEAVLNVSRFETFFPEKRPFFAADSDLLNTPINIFYSRRIGSQVVDFGPGSEVIDDEGRELTISSVPRLRRIWVGSKLTGQASERVGVGVMAALTGAEDARVAGRVEPFVLAPPQLYLAGRGRYALRGGSSHVAVAATAVSRLGGEIYLADHDHDAYAQSVDGVYQSDDNLLRVTGQAVMTELVGVATRATQDGRRCGNLDLSCRRETTLNGTRRDATSIGYAGRVAAERMGARYSGTLAVSTFSPLFDPNGAGFSTAFDRHTVEALFGRFQTTPQGPFQSYQVYAYGTGAIQYDGLLLNNQVSANAELVLRGFQELAVRVGLNLPGAFNPYETVGDGAQLEVPPGAFMDTVFRTDPRKLLTFSVEASGSADFFGGARGASAGAGVEANTNRLQGGLDVVTGYARHMHVLSCTPSLTPMARHGGSGCDIDSLDRSYFFMDQSHEYVGVRTRATLTISPRLSVQFFGELFSGCESLSNPRLISISGPNPTLTYDDMNPTNGIRGDFAFVSAKIQNVLRFELAPGTFLYGVYTREQGSGSGSPTEGDGNFLQGLAAGDVTESVIVKLVLYDGS